MGHRRRRGVALGALFAVGWMVPSNAPAATVNYIPPPPEDGVCAPLVGGQLVYVAGGGEKNRVTVTGGYASVSIDLGSGGPCGYADGVDAGQIVVHDGLADVTPTPSCQRVNRHAVQCPWPSSVEIQLGDQDDALFLGLAGEVRTYVGDIPGVRLRSANVHAGSGNDTLRVLNGVKDYVICGTGYDTVLADLDDALAACEFVDRA